MPLPSAFPVRQLHSLIQSRSQSGAWLRGAGRELRLQVYRAGRTSAILISRDLGYLLRRCHWVAVRIGRQAVLLQAEELIRRRALQVVTGTPYLPSTERLQRLFPGAQVEYAGFSVSLRHHPPEEVLAVCLSQGIPVIESTINYIFRGEHIANSQ